MIHGTKWAIAFFLKKGCLHLFIFIYNLYYSGKQRCDKLKKKYEKYIKAKLKK